MIFHLSLWTGICLHHALLSYSNMPRNIVTLTSLIEINYVELFMLPCVCDHVCTILLLEQICIHVYIDPCLSCRVLICHFWRSLACIVMRLIYYLTPCFEILLFLYGVIFICAESRRSMWLLLSRTLIWTDIVFEFCHWYNTDLDEYNTIFHLFKFRS